MFAGTNKVLAENSCLVISNLCLSDRLTVPILLNLEAQQSLLSLAQNSVDSLQEAALQALYNLLRTEKVWLEQPGQLAAACVEMFSSTNTLVLHWSITNFLKPLKLDAPEEPASTAVVVQRPRQAVSKLTPMSSMKRAFSSK